MEGRTGREKVRYFQKEEGRIGRSIRGGERLAETRSTVTVMGWKEEVTAQMVEKERRKERRKEGGKEGKERGKEKEIEYTISYTHTTTYI